MNGWAMVKNRRAGTTAKTRRDTTEKVATGQVTAINQMD
jgi:hypothetical protein